MDAVAAAGALMLWVILGLAFYFIPTIIAIRRDHPNKVAIILLNFFLGWIGIGWIGALIWSVLAIPEDKQTT